MDSSSKHTSASEFGAPNDDMNTLPDYASSSVDPHGPSTDKEQKSGAEKVVKTKDKSHTEEAMIDELPPSYTEAVELPIELVQAITQGSMTEIHNILEVAYSGMGSRLMISGALALAAANDQREVMEILSKHPGTHKYRAFDIALQSAAREGNDDAVCVLLDFAHKADGIEIDYENVIDTAVATNHSNILKFLASPEFTDMKINEDKYGLALHKAAYRGHAQVVEQLLCLQTASRSIKRADFARAITAAASEGHADILQSLLMNVPTPAPGNSVRAGSLLFFKRKSSRTSKESGDDVCRETALLIAATKGHAQTVRILLEFGTSANVTDTDGTPVLYLTSEQGYLTIVQLLLDHGANINDNKGAEGTALVAALRKGQESVAQLLIENNGDVNAYGGTSYTALQAALLQGYHDIVQRLIRRGAWVTIDPGSHGSALSIASKSSDAEIVQLLLKRGAKVNCSSGYYGHPIAAALPHQDTTVMSILLAAGANPNVECKGNFVTQLQRAIHCGYDNSVRLLLEAGADPNIVGGTYGTALQIACLRGDSSMVELVMANSANLDQVAGKHGTALHAAAEADKFSIVDLLLHAGARTDIRFGEYGTAKVLALRKKRTNALQAFREFENQLARPEYKKMFEEEDTRFRKDLHPYNGKS